MNTITWSSKLNTGVKNIDEQHRRLVKLVNNLVAGIQEGFADDITDGICRELIEYTKYHFRDEEMLMEEVAFPDIEAHKQKHASLPPRCRDTMTPWRKGSRSGRKIS